MCLFICKSIIFYTHRKEEQKQVLFIPDSEEKARASFTGELAQYMGAS